jgi:serine protease
LTGTLDGQPGSNQTIGRGGLGGSFTLTPSTGGTNLTDAQIQSEISNQINLGNLPQPTDNAYYAVNFPTGTTITSSDGSQSCVGGGFCAYHGTFKKGTQNVYYAVLPSLAPGSGCNTGCGSAANFLDNTTSVASHELIEAITDAEIGVATVVGRPLAWYNTSQGEIGDICNAVQGTIVGADGVTYTVQKEYDNVSGTCITSKAVAGNDFSVSLGSTSVSIAQGASGTVTVNTALTSGSAQSISLSITGLPTGVTGSFSPATVTAGGSSTLALTVAATAAAGTTSFTVTGTATSGSHTATGSLTVGTTGGGETVLTNGVPITGLSGATGNQQFFKIDVPSGATNLVISIANGTGDADLYTRFGSRPTTTTFLCRPFRNGNNETCTVAAPQAGTYFVMIRAFATYSGVRLLGSFTAPGGPPPTCAHPICSTGGALTATCDACVSRICAADSFCCSNSWDGICVGEVSSICGQTCP